MTTDSDYDTFVLPSVRRAVIGISTNDWNTNIAGFSSRVLDAAIRSARNMTTDEYDSLRAANLKRMQRFYKVLDVVEKRTSVRNTTLAHLIVAMYFAVHFD